MDLNILRRAVEELEAEKDRLARMCDALGSLISHYEQDQPTRPAPAPKEPVVGPVEEVFPEHGESMRAWRKRHGLTQAEAAQMFGCATANIGHIENGRQRLTERYREAMQRHDKEHPGEAPARPAVGPKF